MNKKPTFLLILMLTSLLLPGVTLATRSQSEDITLALPAEAVRKALNNMLPMPLELDRQQVEGLVTVQSIDRLQIRDNILTLAGILHGENLFITTSLGGQAFRLKVGQIQVPISCDLLLRFDQKDATLYVTPRFAPQSAGQNDPAAALSPLLAGIGNKEYPIDLDQLEPFNASIGGQQIPIEMTPVNIVGREDVLILTLQPKSRKGKR